MCFFYAKVLLLLDQSSLPLLNLRRAWMMKFNWIILFYLFLFFILFYFIYLKCLLVYNLFSFYLYLFLSLLVYYWKLKFYSFVNLFVILNILFSTKQSGTTLMFQLLLSGIIFNNYFVVNWFMKVSFILVYIFVGIWMFFTSSLWLLYFGLELQWMLFIIFFVMGNSIWKGLMNYVIFNELVGTLLMLGLILYMNMFFSSLYYGKIGFYPFMMPMIGIILNVSYLYFLFDPLNKFLYFGSYISYSNSMNISLTSFTESAANAWFMLMLVNFYMIYIFGISFLHSMKIICLVSSLINFLLMIILILSEAFLFAFVYFFIYYFTFFFFLTSLILFFPSNNMNPWDLFWFLVIYFIFIANFSSLYCIFVDFYIKLIIFLHSYPFIQLLLIILFILFILMIIYRYRWFFYMIYCYFRGSTSVKVFCGSKSRNYIIDQRSFYDYVYHNSEEMEFLHYTHYMKHDSIVVFFLNKGDYKRFDKSFSANSVKH